jgi:hypothetical protein
LSKADSVRLDRIFDNGPETSYQSDMSEAMFPSGPWTGFYSYANPADKHRMDLHLTFANGIMTGDGNDDVGLFRIQGRYDAGVAECYWTKVYPGSHEVFYRGYREGKGIWGRWEIGLLGHGGFHIWPRGQAETDQQSESDEKAEPVDAIAGQELMPVG